MDIRVGDKVQIKPGAIDVTNGNRAVSGKLYGEGGPLWATIIFIDENYETYGKYNLPDKITRVICESDSGIVVWQVEPDDIARFIRAYDPTVNTAGTTIQAGSASIAGYDQGLSAETVDVTNNSAGGVNINDMYIPIRVPETGVNTGSIKLENNPGTKDLVPDIGPVTSMGQDEAFTYPNSKGSWRELNEKERKSIGSPSILIDESAIRGFEQRTAFQNPDKRREILREDVENIQNGEAFPKQISPAKGLITAKYDYQIIPGDVRYERSSTLEDKLKQARAMFGIQVHGNNDVGRSVKYYTYNRFKTPDPNIAHTKSFTHVFFTRPDLNILTHRNTGKVQANSQVRSHTEASMIWNMHPELFKLLSNCVSCGDSDNFNLLLSNQVRSFDIIDEQLTVKEVGKSYSNHTMSYGDEYTGRIGGQFSCNFAETCNYDILTLMKLWITYIENVANGAWSPSYNLNANDGSISTAINGSHVYTKTLDYAASAYVFKCGPDGEDVLYWSKYYGVFPVNTGANILSWEHGDSGIDVANPNIRFRYCYKRDLSPISLIEFNNVSKISGRTEYIEAFNPNFGHTTRPFVGSPFITVSQRSSSDLRNGGVDFKRSNTHIRLKFKKISDSALSDDLLFKYNMSHPNVIAKLSK